MVDPRRYFTPPQLAQLWRVTPETILTHVRAGRLRAFTLSPPGSRRPRWRISPSAVEEFERLHAPQTATRTARRARRTPDPAYTEYV